MRKDYLSTHRLIHTDPESLYTICDICCDTVRKEYIEKHRLIHTDPESLTTICNICGDMVSKDHLARHCLQHTNPESLYTTCDICGTTISKDHLTRHKNGISCLYERTTAFEWEDIGKKIAEVLLFGQNWLWKPKISLDKFLFPSSVDQQCIFPEIVIYQERTIDTIIDLKSSIYSLKNKDFNIYPFVAKKVIFWVLKGISCSIEYQGHILQCVSSDDLITLLTNQNISGTNTDLPIQSLIDAIQKLIYVPEEVQALKTASLKDFL